MNEIIGISPEAPAVPENGGFCRVCKRKLRDPTKTIGPVCSKKLAAHEKMMNEGMDESEEKIVQQAWEESEVKA